ncbi:MAG TPA: hypothetical protein VFY65_10370 [Longimicrobium sp.]|nr:hypothetical protein [Longimicrobium sp.]
MQFALENLEAEKILQKILHTAAEQAPVGSGIIIYFVDTVLFPEPKDNLWKQMEGKVEALVQERLDQVVTSIANNAATSLLIRLRSLGDQLRQFRYLTDIAERKARLGFLLSQIESAAAECAALPNAHLLTAAEVLRPLTLTHVAVLMEQKQLEPHRYEHQAALNHAAIMYSDLAAKLYDRARWWRQSLIAGGNGIIHMTDLFVDEVGRTKKVQMVFYDRFADNRWQPGERGMAVKTMTTGTVKMDQRSDEYETVKGAMEKAIPVYAKQVYDGYEALWNKKLLKYTQQMLNLVDWPVVDREKKGEIVFPRRVYTFPLVPAAHRSPKAGVLDRLDLFLEQQMDQFTVAGPRYAQTYRLPAAELEGKHGEMHHRADTYDTAVACIYFMQRGRMDRARDLGDALVVALNHDGIGGGRLVAATRAGELLDRGLASTTSIFHRDGGRRDVGNMCWAGLALTRLHHLTGQYRYLHAAETIGHHIVSTCAVDDAWGGFSGGQDHWGTVYRWRSVEHNVDAFSFFANLHHLTGEAHWAEASASARKLVLACRITEKPSVVYYCTGTKSPPTAEELDAMVKGGRIKPGETPPPELNSGVVPTDTQSWTALAGIDPGAAEGYSLIYMMQQMRATSAGFVGFRFARDGTEVQNEATAGAVMALWLTKSNLRHAAGEYYDSLLRQIEQAPNTDGYGVVATPAPEATTGPGLGWSYFNFLHVASSAWTGLALLARDAPGANPYAPLSTVRTA